MNTILSLAKKTVDVYMAAGFWGCARKIVHFIKRRTEKTYFGYTSHDPLISVIAVNFNEALYLPDFLESLSKQSYRNFEIIIVDNGSIDSSEEVVNQNRELFPNNLLFIKAGKNLGFADGNNFALDYAKGEFLALLNIDTRVHEDWLREMVEAIRLDGNAAIVAPKILFWERFHNIEICSDQQIELDLTILEQSLSYKKYFVRTGLVRDGFVQSDKSRKIVISIPVQEKPIKIRLSVSAISPCNVEIRSQTKSLCRTTFTEVANMDVNFSINTVGNAGFIVNNAGSIVGEDGMPCDRGFGEYDYGQYDQKCYLPYFCGCAALIRRAAILDRPIFVPEFFAYYEDSELSRWITSSGLRILYAPRSIVYHRHSATSSEGSPVWQYLVRRGRLLFTYTGDVDVLARQLSELMKKFKDSVDPDLVRVLADYDQRLIRRLKAGEPIVERRKAIGIYNSYWNTYGGGESHALSFVSELQEYGPVNLISESDFDIDALSKYFSIDLSHCRKLILPKIRKEFTERFFLFVNSTFYSDLPSRATHSWYIVSFPHRHASKEMIRSYYFLFNSSYTERWARIYWGDSIRGKIIHPVRMLKTRIKNTSFSQCDKKKIILSVGRFTPFGHSKNQLEIAKAFCSLVKESSDDDQWKLIIAGSLDRSNSDHVAYYNEVKNCLNGLNADLFPNAERHLLDRLYLEASIYVHATGMGRDKNKEPQKMEHFGIVVVEAIQSGCIPIVYHVGGPAELVRSLGIGYVFSSGGSLKARLEDLTRRDFSALINECKLVQERGLSFVNAELSSPLPIDWA